MAGPRSSPGSFRRATTSVHASSSAPSGAGSLAARLRPGFRGLAGDRPDEILRLPRQGRFLRQPIGDALRPRIVRGCRQSEISEAILEVGEIACRGGDGGRDVEGVEEAAFLRGGRHELGDSLGALGAEGVAAEAAFLPQKTGEETARNAVRIGRRLDQLAKRVCLWRGAGAASFRAVAKDADGASRGIGCASASAAPKMASAASTAARAWPILIGSPLVRRRAGPCSAMFALEQFSGKLSGVRRFHDAGVPNNERRESQLEPPAHAAADTRIPGGWWSRGGSNS